MGRYTNLRQIQQLDPIEDHEQICYLMAGYEFPWDITRALEIALFRTFCAPSISALLDKTGEFHHRPQKRYDDTGLIVAEILKWGYDSDRGQEAIRRMNQIHGHFAISNDDFIYVLSTFVYEPIRWIERFGWRPLCQQERLALFYFWQAVGQRMHIRNIPDTYEALEQYNLNYEQQHLHYSLSNQAVGESTRRMFLSWFPAGLRPWAKPCFHAILDDTMLRAFNFPVPSPWLRHAIATSLRLRGQILRYCPPRRQGKFFTQLPNRSYPRGYQLTDLGPPHMLPTLNNSAKPTQK